MPHVVDHVVLHVRHVQHGGEGGEEVSLQPVLLHERCVRKREIVRDRSEEHLDTNYEVLKQQHQYIII